MKREKLLLATTMLAVGLGLAGCGGGGGSADLSSQNIDGGVYASIVKGAKVCAEDVNTNQTLDCAKTNDNGTFSLSLPPDVNLENVKLSLIIEDANGTKVEVGEVNYENATVDNATGLVAITPINLAENDNETAQAIGAFIHALGGEVNATENSTVDLSEIESIENVTVELNGTEVPITEVNEPIEKVIKEHHKISVRAHHKTHGDIEVEVDTTNSTPQVICEIDSDGDGKKESQPVEYSLEKHKQEIEKHIKELESLHSEETSGTTESEEMSGTPGSGTTGTTENG